MFALLLLLQPPTLSWTPGTNRKHADASRCAAEKGRCAGRTRRNLAWRLSAASSANTSSSALHGSHHGAQKSTATCNSSATPFPHLQHAPYRQKCASVVCFEWLGAKRWQQGQTTASTMCDVSCHAR